MNINRMLEQLGVPGSRRPAFLARCGKAGIQLFGDEIKDAVAADILAESTGMLPLTVFVKEHQDRLSQTGLAPLRIWRDLKEMIRFYHPEIMKDAADTLYCFDVNEILIDRNRMDLVDDLVERYLEWIHEDRKTPVSRRIQELKRKQKRTKQKNSVARDPQAVMEESEALIQTRDAAEALELKIRDLEVLIRDGKIGQTDGKVIRDDIMTALEQRKSVISSMEIMLALSDGTRFSRSSYLDRNKFIDLMELNDYFGAERVNNNAIRYEIPAKDSFYIRRADFDRIKTSLREWFLLFGFTEQEKTEYYLKTLTHNPQTAEYIRKWMKQVFFEEQITPAVTAVVKAVLSLDRELSELNSKKLKELIDSFSLKASRIHMISLCEFIRARVHVRYKKVRHREPRRWTSESARHAYNKKQVFGFAQFLFNEEHIRSCQMVERALEDHFVTEQWLFHCIHYFAAWRQSDMCRCWPKLNLISKPDLFPEIDRNDLKTVILEGDTRLFRRIGDHVVSSMKASGAVASKNLGILKAGISPVLREHVGRLQLIAEYHYILSGDGYPQENRMARYNSRVRMRKTYGSEIQDIFGKNNFESTRMNKSVLQAIEVNARKKGCSPLLASAIASLARGHRTKDSISFYVGDHEYDAESPEAVAYLLMSVGVLNVLPYHLLSAAYPNVFSKLDVISRTRLMEMTGISAYSAELAFTMESMSMDLEDAFRNADVDRSTAILSAMVRICNGFAAAKDEGTACIRRAFGLTCPHGTWDSCIGNVCRYNVLTEDGIPALARVIRWYDEMHQTTGNIKYKAVLEQKIIPAYKNILENIARGMDADQEKELIEAVTREARQAAPES